MESLRTETDSLSIQPVFHFKREDEDYIASSSCKSLMNRQ